MLHVAGIGHQVRALAAESAAVGGLAQAQAHAPKQLVGAVGQLKRFRGVYENELHDPISPGVLLKRLKELDPEIREEHYIKVPNRTMPCDAHADWDVEGLVEDLRLTEETYCCDALEVALQPIRDEIKLLGWDQVRPTGLATILPGRLLLGDADSARDLDTLFRAGVKKIINCSPQTVKTGVTFYQSVLPRVQYIELWEDDLLDFDILHDLDAVWNLVSSGGCCLLHCEQGVNRSAALVVALHMRLSCGRGHGALSPEERLKTSWQHVAQCKGRVLTNTSFQRQLLLFARLGLQWFPSVTGVWRTSRERCMARFRELAENIGHEIVCCNAVPEQRQRRAVIFIRDGTMRNENRMEGAFDLSSADACKRAEHRIRSYAIRCLVKLAARDAQSPTPEVLLPQLQMHNS